MRTPAHTPARRNASRDSADARDARGADAPSRFRRSGPSGRAGRGGGRGSRRPSGADSPERAQTRRAAQGTQAPSDAHAARKRAKAGLFRGLLGQKWGLGRPKKPPGVGSPLRIKALGRPEGVGGYGRRSGTVRCPLFATKTARKRTAGKSGFVRQKRLGSQRPPSPISAVSWLRAYSGMSMSAYWPGDVSCFAA